MDILTIIEVLAIGGAVAALASPSSNKGTSTGLVNTLFPPKKKPCHGGARMLPPKITRYHFPTPTSGKMMLNELHYARDNGILLTPERMCKSALNKIGYEGYGTPMSDSTVINPNDVIDQGKSQNVLGPMM